MEGVCFGVVVIVGSVSRVGVFLFRCRVCLFGMRCEWLCIGFFVFGFCRCRGCVLEDICMCRWDFVVIWWVSGVSLSWMCLFLFFEILGDSC